MLFDQRGHLLSGNVVVENSGLGWKLYIDQRFGVGQPMPPTSLMVTSSLFDAISLRKASTTSPAPAASPERSVPMRTRGLDPSSSQVVACLLLQFIKGLGHVDPLLPFAEFLSFAMRSFAFSAVILPMSWWSTLITGACPHAARQVLYFEGELPVFGIALAVQAQGVQRLFDNSLGSQYVTRGGPSTLPLRAPPEG